ncbi:MAG TPA: hypothetical protein VFA36_00660 [Burkholderiales bacterium]|jgi:hypothetical protein|nr:hypothetical protein [Burkholderiales bacterium]
MPDLSFLTQTATLPWILGAAALLSLGLILVLAGLTALFALHPLSFMTRTLLGLLLISLGALEGTITIGIQGYRSLTQEDLAARISVRPYASQKFTAKLQFPDGHEASFSLAGDEIYIDARILKWHALANMLGLTTAYELDRIGGRYREVEQEKSAARTLYPLGREKPVDLFALRKRYPFLEHFVDAQYGSAAYVPVAEPAELELRVSTTGLLIRQVAPPKSAEAPR